MSTQNKGKSYTQPQAFRRLMPHIYIMRKKGVSFTEITDLLTQVGFKLKVSSVRTYFSKMLPSCREECVGQMDELKSRFKS